MPKATILRLETYLIYIEQLEKQGKKNARSDELARMFEISSSRVRQDLIALGVTGKPRSGYDIKTLRQAIIEALDVQNIKRIALVGCGNLGRALAESDVWQRGGFELKAVFDNDPKVISSQVAEMTVRSITELFGVIKSEDIETACIATPAGAAQDAADMLIAAKIKAIWNFAPVEIATPPDVIVENQHLEHGLMTISYKLQTKKPEVS